MSAATSAIKDIEDARDKLLMLQAAAECQAVVKAGAIRLFGVLLLGPFGFVMGLSGILLASFSTAPGALSVAWAAVAASGVICSACVALAAGSKVTVNDLSGGVRDLGNKLVRKSADKER